MLPYSFVLVASFGLLPPLTATYQGPRYEGEIARGPILTLSVASSVFSAAIENA